MNLRHAIAVLAATSILNPSGLRAAEPLFGREVVPTLHKLGCSAGTCHGAFAGKGGFRLSLFASDPAADHRQLRDAFSRRIDRLRPGDSLILRKPTGALPHGGGVRLNRNSPEYQLLEAWIRTGANFDSAAEGRVVKVQVEPATALCKVAGPPVPLRVLAKLEGGDLVDVTRFTRFEVYDSTIATVDDAGRACGQRGGDTPILAHYAGQIGYTIALAPRDLPPGVNFPNESPADVVDRMILDKLKRLNILPASLASDTDFLRRVTLDVTGQLPTPGEVRKFLAESSPDRRARKIDELLLHPLHAAVWATKLCDVTGMDNRVLYDRAVCNAHDWYRNKFAANLPWDRLVENVLTATAADNRTLEELAVAVKSLAAQKKKGQKNEPATEKPWQSGYALRNTLDVFFDNFKFRIQAGPDKGKIDPQPIALHVATAFLGVRLECAECHKHPHDRWTQQDFLSFTAAFSYINRGSDPVLRKKKINLAAFT